MEALSMHAVSLRFTTDQKKSNEHYLYLMFTGDSVKTWQKQMKRVISLLCKTAYLPPLKENVLQINYSKQHEVTPISNTSLIFVAQQLHPPRGSND